MFHNKIIAPLIEAINYKLIIFLEELKLVAVWLQMTASHLPYTRNGLKFFTRKGGLTSPEVEEICDKAARKYANRLTKVSTMLNNLPTRVDFMSTYAKHLRDNIKERVNHPLHYDTPLKGFQVLLSIVFDLFSFLGFFLFVCFLYCFHWLSFS